MSIASLQLARCRSCNASIYWLKNDTTGRTAPIDARQDPTGPVTIAAEGGELRYHVLTKAELEAGDRRAWEELDAAVASLSGDAGEGRSS